MKRGARGSPEKVTFGAKLEGGEGFSCVTLWGKTTPAEGTAIGRPESGGSDSDALKDQQGG